MEQSLGKNDGRLNHYFLELGAKLNEFRRYKKKMDVYLSFDFNVFVYISPHENRLSDIMAEMLNPDGNHGQGEIFLREFLDTIEKKDIDIKKYSITREAVTDSIKSSLRRIDIVVSLDGFGIAVENKPWSKEGDQQVQDYCDHMKNTFKDFVLVYLSGDGSYPGSIKEDNEYSKHIIIYPYGEGFIKWLQRCYKECRSERYRYFIKDFIHYVDNEFGAN